MELLAPAGGFSSAVYAFSGGADAVYAGMQRFSARQGAQNVTFDEFRRLKRAAEHQGKRIYAAVNTLVMDHEMEILYQQLRHCAYLQIDGVIVQDLGVAAVIRRDFPSLILHGSTQMAVHTVEGARQLLDMGFSRAVLARELSLEEIAAIQSGCPELSYEVFVHGALCYSVSGLCLASGRMLGRSANRGMCAQICRTWSALSARGERGYFFSMKDLHGSQVIGELAKMGVESLKIEGRMKSPEYSEAASAYYRGIIDTGFPDPEQYRRLQLLFSRDTTDGWLKGNIQSMTSREYPSHIGIPAGRVVTSSRTHAVIDAREKLSLHDGLLARLNHPGSSALPEWLPFSISEISEKKGAAVTVRTPRPLAPGTEVRKISDHRLRRPEIRSSSFPPWQHPVDLQITITDTSVTCTSLSPEAQLEQDITIQQSRKPFDVSLKAAEVFKESGESLFTLGEFTLVNRSPFPDNQLFIPPSQLKQLRRSWYELLDKLFAATPKNIPTPDGSPGLSGTIPDRDLLSPKSPSGFPWIVPGCPSVPEDLHRDDRYCYIPLSPVLFNAKGYEQQLQQLLQACISSFPGLEPLLGVNNIAHIPLVNHIASSVPAAVWIDVHCYIANRAAAEALAGMLDIPVRFGYWWIEHQNVSNDIKWPFPVGAAGPSRTIPIFISRTSFRDETGSDVQELLQQERTFRIREYGGITCVFVD